ncbi:MULTISPECIES: lysophospholipid acyltransferase family protein [Marinobacter]|uniref:1-acyl-sn-glycerol-3-phosphate acyltransferase n=1 Tax=Marinobacter profundi TaxID=2666256 RepID=A0A2G1UHF4_9GAMM|nr:MULTISPECIES: 1-acylglycerol-3-phosphate O-acyltransferase [Marinobacter]MBD3657543.1 1-acylglycerol-3-phosphate O-acyltransferase [Marinobacter sp.]PHQ13875.1 1-acyl-sn-glycerol-3-phosphate acyltransferase [Marinobacter profundi]
MGVVRELLAWLLVPVICLVALFFYLVRPFNPDNNRILGWYLARAGRGVLGMKRPLEGAENMPRDRPTVVIANHQYNDDLFVLGDLLPPRTVTVGKSALAWLPFFGQVFWLGGNVMINRAQSHRAIAMMQVTTEAIARDHKSLWVFPEGTRSKGRGLQKLKKGAFHAAVAAQAPITMVCAGVYDNRRRGLLGARRPVAVRILPPVETRGLTNADIPRLMEQCRQQMAETIADLTDQHR